MKHHNNPHNSCPLLLVRNKSIIKCFKLLLTAKIWVYKIASSSKKVIWSELGENSTQIKLCLQAKTSLNKYAGGFWYEKQQKMTFTLEEALLWTHILVKNVLMMDLFLTNSFWLHKMLTDWPVCGLLWCFYHLSLLFWWNSLQMIHWLANKGMLCWSK